MTEQVTKTIIVDSPVGDVYSVWANFQNFPHFMENIKEVRKTGDGMSHWVMDGPLGKEVHWDAKTTRMDENREIAWNSTGGDVETTGRVLFREISSGQTEVEITLKYVPPNAIANLFANPEGRLETDLANFKRYLESGTTNA